MESSRAKTQEQTHLATEDVLESIFRDATFFSAREEDSLENPATIEEALNGEEGDQWKKAIDEEMATLKNMGTWELADLPEGRKPIGCKWVFVKKRKIDQIQGTTRCAGILAETWSRFQQ